MTQVCEEAAVIGLVGKRVVLRRIQEMEMLSASGRNHDDDDAVETLLLDKTDGVFERGRDVRVHEREASYAGG